MRQSGLASWKFGGFRAPDRHDQAPASLRSEQKFCTLASGNRSPSGVAGGVGHPFVRVYRSGKSCFLPQLHCPHVRYSSVTYDAFGNGDWSYEAGT